MEKTSQPTQALTPESIDTFRARGFLRGVLLCSLCAYKQSKIVNTLAGSLLLTLVGLCLAWALPIVTQDWGRAAHVDAWRDELGIAEASTPAAQQRSHAKHSPACQLAPQPRVQRRSPSCGSAKSVAITCGNDT